MIVGAVGAILIGTGLIAVLASKWADFSRWVRLALGPLAAAQAVSRWVLRRNEATKPWQREAAAFVQTLAAGAAMALVSQIYNLPGKWTDLVFWWCVVSVPLAWVLRSQAVGIAYGRRGAGAGAAPGRATVWQGPERLARRDPGHAREDRVRGGVRGLREWCSRP